MKRAFVEIFARTGMDDQLLKIIAVENVKQHAALGRIRETKTRLDGNPRLRFCSISIVRLI